MRFDRDHLTFKALAALDEAARQCSAAPITRTVALRFALAYLYAIGNGERRLFDEFWRAIAEPHVRITNGWEASYLRSSTATGCIQAIAVSVGYPVTPEALQRLCLRQGPSDGPL